MSRPALILGLEAGGLGLTRGLGRAGLDVHGISFRTPDLGNRSRYLRSHETVTGDGEESLDEAVLSSIRARAGGDRLVLFPERDQHVAFVLRNWDAVSEVADVPLPPDPGLVRDLAAKDTLIGIAEQAGVPIPRTTIPRDADDVRAAACGVQVLVKPVASEDYAAHFGRKAVLAEDGEDAVAAWREARDAGFATVLQEYVPGSHERIFSLFTYVGRAGEPLASVVGRKVRQGPVRFGSSTVFRVEPDRRVFELGHGLLASAGYRGFAHVELAYDRRDDSYRLLEVNTRIPIWAAIGMSGDWNMARVAHEDLSGGSPGPLGELAEERTWIYTAKDVVTLARMIRCGEAGVADAFRARRGRIVGAVFARDDPRPAGTLARWTAVRTMQKLTS